MIVATYIANFLKENGITHVFGYDGSMMLKIADEISLLKGIDFYQGFHEQASSFAADAYARIKRDIGVLLVTSGPGAINALAGCADAFMDSIPMLIITGQDRLEHIKGNPGVRLNGFQDLDVVNVARPITKYAVQITDASRLAYELEKCLFIAMEGRRGPVLIDVPMNVQFWDIPTEMEHFLPDKTDAVINKEVVSSILERLYRAKRPVIIAGGGIRIASAEENLEQFAEMTKIPVVTTLNGHDAYSKSIGSSGLYGLPEANLAIYHADVVLALGVRFGQQQVGKLIDEYTKADIIHVDIDAKELGRVLRPVISLCADAKDFLTGICNDIDVMKLQCYDNWNQQIYTWRSKYENDLYVNKAGIEPVKLVRLIGNNCPDDAVFTNDVGQNTMWVCQGLLPKGNQRLLTSSGYASMGFSLPAAIGAKMAEPDRVVISFSGDGGFQMNLQELQFVKLHKLNIKFVVFNNNTLGMMREVQRVYYNNNYVGSNVNEFICVDLEKIAVLYELDYLVIYEESDFAFVKEVLSSSKAAIIDCRLPIDTYLRNWNEFKLKYSEALTDLR